MATVCQGRTATLSRNGPRSTIAFASALQDRYGVKKVNNSATVGVGAIGSLSLPFSSSDEALVKVASETLTDERFYDRFFALIDRFLPEATEETPAEARPVLPAQPPSNPCCGRLFRRRALRPTSGSARFFAWASADAVAPR
jgi:hypothetical protein